MVTTGKNTILQKMTQFVKEKNIKVLASTEVGEDSIRAIALRDNAAFGRHRIIVDPKIVWKSSQTAYGEEQSEFLPGVTRTVLRPKKIKVRGYTIDNKQVEVEYNDEVARYVCRAIDHLNGKTLLNLD